MDKRLEKIESYIRQYHMIEKGDRIVIGVSGGADSVCLLMALCSLQEKLGFQVLVCHVNHELRGEEAAQDEAYVEMLCHKMQVPFFAFHENVELIAKKRKESLEEAGRYVRRQAFEQLCREQGGTKIATAHHSNDNAETMLLNMARGTGLRGLCGIRPVYGKWIRPLLELSREEIEQWLKDCDIRYCVDETNQEDEYTRNRIRHHVIPTLEEQVNTRTVEHFVKLSEQAEEIYEYLEKQTDQAWNICAKQADGLQSRKEIFLKAEEMKQLDPVIKKLLIQRSVSEVAGAQKDIESRHILAVLQLFERQTGRQIDLPYSVTAKRMYEGVLLTKGDKKVTSVHQKEKRKEESDFVLQLQIPGETQIPGTNLKICCTISGENEKNSAKEIPQKSYTKCFDYDIIKSSLCVRYRRPGDYFTIDGEGKKKKLKSYFIDEKIPQEERDRQLLIAEESHIVWIPGRRMSSYYQVGDQTKKILKIKIMEE